MHELLGQIYAYVRQTWRHRWLALAVAWVVCIAGWVYVSQMPDVYRASARVHVDTDSMLRPLLRGIAVDTNISQRVNLMTRTLITRPNMEKVARMTDMHLDAHTDSEMEAIIERLHNNVTIQGDQRQNLYTLSYNDKNPEQAHSVVQAMLTIFTESALGETRQDGDMAQDFIEKQLEKYEKRLSEAEQRLADFRRENVGMLPGDRGDYYQRLQNAQSELEEARQRLAEAESRRDEVRRQLAGEEPTFGITDYQSSGSSTGNSAIDKRIENLQQRLDELLLTYTEQHPDVEAINRTIEDLKEQKAEQQALLPDGGQSVVNEDLATNPVYQQMRITLSNAEVEISSLRSRVRRYENKVKELQRMVDTIPNVEAKLKQLDRDYRVNRENYEKLLQRREAANLSQNVEAGGQQVQFRVIEPARVPESPAAPNRLLLHSAVLIVALGLGVGLALLFAQLRPVFDNRRTLNTVTGFPVLGSVSLILDDKSDARERVKIYSFGAVTGMLLLVYAAVIIMSMG
ncbi:XrtA system polysaccharide chain length determinant [Thiohalophilus sp.]|uniref:XrtA system polysaccharide chain length determinant n=1 Tax=Thiohalophilus sp. TaxID=3028392 RepID=UPI002ACD6C88|nr:XrtA system polysaccharide chain length determinant [Thiohalophilus sp.]MDZ7803459.1 XrtA system polysaccharide chain length determinant [Thiohalophilus sp.]